jgi:hypothetical protein
MILVFSDLSVATKMIKNVFSLWLHSLDFAVPQRFVQEPMPAENSN